MGIAAGAGTARHSAKSPVMYREMSAGGYVTTRSNYTRSPGINRGIDYALERIRRHAWRTSKAFSCRGRWETPGIWLEGGWRNDNDPAQRTG